MDATTNADAHTHTHTLCLEVWMGMQMQDTLQSDVQQRTWKTQAKVNKIAEPTPKQENDNGLWQNSKTCYINYFFFIFNSLELLTLKLAVFISGPLKEYGSFSMTRTLQPKIAKGIPKDGQREPKGTPKGAKGSSKSAPSRPEKVPKRRPKGHF